MLGDFLSFHLVKKMGEGIYLSEDQFIIERIRKERALDKDHMEENRKIRKKSRTRNGRFNFS
jgi:hypothetical protein